jgi:hypothetical protein
MEHAYHSSSGQSAADPEAERNLDNCRKYREGGNAGIL